MANAASSSAIVHTSSVAQANSHVQIAGGNSGLSISLHPLPILSISEHYTRSVLLSSPSTKIVGALLGTQTGREVSIVNTFELIATPGSSEAGDHEGTDVNMDGGASGLNAKWTMDREFLHTRSNQFKEVFPTLELIGWYSIGAEPSKSDVELQTQMQEIIETPLFLLLTPPGSAPPDAASSSDLPLKVYESALDAEVPSGVVTATGGSSDGPGGIAGGGKFVELSYTIETGEAERIAVDAAAKAGGIEEGEGAGNALIASLTTQRNAIGMLYDRMKVMLEYIQGIENGSAQVDHAILREISATVATLPVMDEDAFKAEYMIESNDVELTAYLAELTKSLAVLNDIADKASTINAKLFDKGSDFAGVYGHSGGGDGVGRRHKTRAGGRGATGPGRGGWGS